MIDPQQFQAHYTKEPQNCLFWALLPINKCKCKPITFSRKKKKNPKGFCSFQPIFLLFLVGSRDEKGGSVHWQNAIAAYYLTHFIPSLFQTQHQSVDDHSGGNSLVSHQEQWMSLLQEVQGNCVVLYGRQVRRIYNQACWWSQACSLWTVVLPLYCHRHCTAESEAHPNSPPVKLMKSSQIQGTRKPKNKNTSMVNN